MNFWNSPWIALFQTVFCVLLLAFCERVKRLYDNFSSGNIEHQRKIARQIALGQKPTLDDTSLLIKNKKDFIRAVQIVLLIRAIIVALTGKSIFDKKKLPIHADPTLDYSLLETTYVSPPKPLKILLIFIPKDKRCEMEGDLSEVYVENFLRKGVLWANARYFRKLALSMIDLILPSIISLIRWFVRLWAGDLFHRWIK